MPIVQFYLGERQYDEAAVGALLVEGSHFYAHVLYPGMSPPPLERVRAFVTPIPPDQWATGGVLVSEGGKPAPYFTCLALAGRPEEQLQGMLAGFTDLIVKHLQCDKALVRGMVITIDPALWSIGGKPAAIVRAQESDARRGGT